jgi:hypothetical protein
MPELSLTVTGAPMISLRKPLGSLESPAASGAGLSPLVDMGDGLKTRQWEHVVGVRRRYGWLTLRSDSSLNEKTAR